MLLADVVAALPFDSHPFLADVNEITTKASTIGKAILAATVVLALLAAFVTTAQRRWVVVGSILLIGGFMFMVIGAPAEVLGQLGGAIKKGIWDPIINSL
jgi:hypothetical protein